jgi:hypothetical protein
MFKLDKTLKPNSNCSIAGKVKKDSSKTPGSEFTITSYFPQRCYVMASCHVLCNPVRILITVLKTQNYIFFDSLSHAVTHIHIHIHKPNGY